MVNADKVILKQNKELMIKLSSFITEQYNLHSPVTFGDLCDILDEFSEKLK
jgi:hypothetical protein